MLQTANCKLQTANCKLQTANCKLQTANCKLHYNINTILSTNTRLSVWVLLLVLNVPFATFAAINCTALGISQIGSLGTSINDVLIAPEDFSTLPIGEPVSLVRAVSVFWDCDFPANMPRLVGAGSDVLATATAVTGLANVFTTPELQTLGLGYSIYWQTHEHGSFAGMTPRQEMASVSVKNQPVHWFDAGISPVTETLRITTGIGLQFYKIGPIPDTGGTTIPMPVTTHVANLYLTDQASPLNVTGVNPIHWSTPTLTTKVRACTPLVDQTVNFTMTDAGMAASPAGSVLASRTFNLTFTCPYVAFERIGYIFQPVYGTHSATVMKLKENAGSVQGVGIQIRSVDAGWLLQFNQTYYMAEFNKPPWDYPDANRDNALNATRTKSIDFDAELVRVSGPFEPGTINSALIVVMRYK